MSSIARSFPQPPTPLFFIFSTTDVSAPVVNTLPNCCQTGAGVPMILPVLPEPNSTVSALFHTSNLTFIGISPAPQKPEFGLYTFNNQAENSNVVLTQRPLTIFL